MKIIRLVVTCLVMSVGVVLLGAEPSGASLGIEVIEPNGGENQILRGDQVISWNPGPYFGYTCNIYYSDDSGASYDEENAIAIGVENNGTYDSWDTTTVDDTTQGRIKVVLIEEQMSDESNEDFTIDNHLELYSPNGGEEWSRTQTISWDPGPYTTETCTIYYSISGGAYMEIASALLNDGSYDWDTTTIQNTAACKIKVAVMSGGGAELDSDESAAYFIVNNLRLNSPNGGETWSGVQTISWDTGPYTEDCTISYSISGGADMEIAAGVENNGSYDWDTTTAPNTTECKIKVSLMHGGEEVYDESLNYFTVDNLPPDITPPTVNIIDFPAGTPATSKTIRIDADDDITGVVDPLEVTVSTDPGNTHYAYFDTGTIYEATNVPLVGGGVDNIVTVTASDGAGNEATDQVSVFAADEIVLPGQSIQTAVGNVTAGGLVYICDATYVEDISVEDKAVSMAGRSNSAANIEGKISLHNSDSSIKNLSIDYTEGNYVAFGSVSILDDAGITAVDSEVTVEDCIITPLGTSHQGKGIQIWNLDNTPVPISPVIDGCTVTQCEVGVWLYSQEFAGAINYTINGNDLQNNTYGIVLRMHKETPLKDGGDDGIYGNTIADSSEDGIHITYADEPLLTNRLSHITNNTFLNNTNDIFCDANQTSY